MMSAFPIPDSPLPSVPAAVPFERNDATDGGAESQPRRDSRKRESIVGDVPGRHSPVILVLDEDERTHSAVEMSAGDFTRILHAATPMEAFRWLREESVDVVVSSNSVGGVNLTQLLCLAKREHPGIASIIVSAESCPLLARLAADGEIFGQIEKPIKAGSLRASIKAALARHFPAAGFAAPARRDGGIEVETRGWLSSLQHLFGC